MGMMKLIRGQWKLGLAALGALSVIGAAQAQETRSVTTEYSGSVVIFPKVIWDGTRDTVIQISNTGNTLAYAHCFYINASARPNVFGDQQCAETDFDIVLTRQQPTIWVASLGRRTANEGFGTYGSGYDPGLIPPVPAGFQGELKCIQVDDSGSPMPGNRLKGEATLQDSSGDLSSYNAIALPANPGVVPGSDLELTLTNDNPGGEYAACPDTLIFNHFAHGAVEPALSSPTALGGQSACVGGNCSINTTLTMVPCSEDLENQIPGKVTIDFLIYDEFESRLSTSTTVTCWLNLPLNQIAPAGPKNPFTPGALGGSTTRHTRIRPVPGQGGVLGVAEETRTTSSGATAVAAYNLQTQGNRFDGETQGDTDVPTAAAFTDRISIPVE